MTTYPEWLGFILLESSPPWEQGRTQSFAEFLATYTLHDSVWVTLLHDLAYDPWVILVIRWDAVWLPDEIAKSTSIIAEWPLLFVQIKDVAHVATSRYKDIGGLQRGIARADVEQIDGKYVLVIDDHYGGSVEIVYAGEVTFVALDQKQALLSI